MAPDLPALPALTEADLLQLRIYKSMSPEQKWEQAFNMRELAWAIKTSVLKSMHPDWPEDRIESAVREIFVRATT